MGLRDEIREFNDIETVAVHVPEWGRTVHVRALSGIDRDRFDESLVDRSANKPRVNLQRSRARLVVLSVVDEHGEPVFNDNDIDWLAVKSAKALERICKVAKSLSGMNEDDFEDALKN